MKRRDFLKLLSFLPFSELLRRNKEKRPDDFVVANSMNDCQKWPTVQYNRIAYGNNQTLVLFTQDQIFFLNSVDEVQNLFEKHSSF